MDQQHHLSFRPSGKMEYFHLHKYMPTQMKQRQAISAVLKTLALNCQKPDLVKGLGEALLCLQFTLEIYQNKTHCGTYPIKSFVQELYNQSISDLKEKMFREHCNT
jgi:hypothetical protein